MKKFLILFFGLVLSISFSACLANNPQVSWEKTSVKKIERSEKLLYFEYPEDSEISLEGEKGSLKYLSCDVRFGDLGAFSSGDLRDAELIEKMDGKIKYSSFLRDNQIKAYFVGDNQLDFAFWVINEAGDASSCTDLVDYLANSLTDNFVYKNEKYNFSLPVPDGFDIEYLPEEAGIVMRKRIVLGDLDKDLVDMEEYGERFPEAYTVEVRASVLENPGLWANLGDYLSEKYDGFSFEYAAFSDAPSVFVDEQVNENAYRYFFVMQDGAEEIYEVYLKVPAVYFSREKEFFDEEIAKGVKLSF